MISRIHISALALAAIAPILSGQMNLHAADPAPQPAEVKVRLLADDATPGPVVVQPMVVKTDAEWRKQLGDEAYKVLRAAGTERAFCGNLVDNKKDGIYFCAGCDLPLFSSTSKFHSGSGWPSFFAPFAKENITEKSDNSYGMERTEINCARCGGHLGHVFPDGPAPTGLRYCLNSVSLVFRPIEDLVGQP